MCIPQQDVKLATAMKCLVLRSDSIYKHGPSLYTSFHHDNSSELSEPPPQPAMAISTAAP